MQKNGKTKAFAQQEITRREKRAEKAFGQKVKPVQYINLIFVVAPDIPHSEVTALETHYAEALNDPAYTVVTNYKIGTINLCYDRKSEFLLVNAPGVPASEVKLLKKKVMRAISASRKTKRPTYVVTNYEVSVETRPASGVVIH